MGATPASTESDLSPSGRLADPVRAAAGRGAGSDIRSPALAGLLGEAETRELLCESFGRTAWRGRLDRAAAAELFDWRRLNAVLAEHRLPGSRLKLERGGAPVPASAWRVRGGEAVDAPRLLHELRGGATLILDQAHELSPPLTGLCEGLAADFTCWCGANLYASWGETQGFDVHWDDHEVFVIQAQGRKRWSIYGQTRAAPVVRNDPPDHQPPAEPLETFVLEPGDALYLPRGCWHAVVGLGEPSLHLTVGLTRRTGSEFLHWLADYLLSEAAVRSDLPLERGDAVVAEALRTLIASLPALDPQDLARLYRRHVEAGLPHRPALSLPSLGGGETALRPDDRLRLAPGSARLEPGPTPRSVVLGWRGVRFTVDAVLEGPLRTLAAGRAVRFSDLAACASETQATTFVRELIARGAVQLSPES